MTIAEPDEAPRGCTVCQGSGTTAFETRLHSPSGRNTARLLETRACVCVRDLPPVPGPVRWWDLETVFERTVELGPEAGTVIVEVRVEVPRREDGRRVDRTRENWWVEVEDLTLNVEQAHALVASLLGGSADIGDLRLEGDAARQLAQVVLEASAACVAADVPVEL